MTLRFVLLAERELGKVSSPLEERASREAAETTVFLRASPPVPHSQPPGALRAPAAPVGGHRHGRARPGAPRHRAPLRLAVPAPGRPLALLSALPRHAPSAGAVSPPVPTVWGRLHLGENGESGSEDQALEEVPRIEPPPPRRFPHPSQSCFQGARPLAAALRNYASDSPQSPRTCLGEERMGSRGPDLGLPPVRASSPV